MVQAPWCNAQEVTASHLIAVTGWVLSPLRRRTALLAESRAKPESVGLLIDEEGLARFLAKAVLGLSRLWPYLAGLCCGPHFAQAAWLYVLQIATV